MSNEVQIVSTDDYGTRDKARKAQLNQRLKNKFAQSIERTKQKNMQKDLEVSLIRSKKVSIA